MTVAGRPICPSGARTLPISGSPPLELRRPRRGRHAARPGGDGVFRLAFRPPYDWRQVQEFLGTRAIPGVESVDARGYARTVRLAAGHAVVCVRALDGVHALELRVQGAAPRELFALVAAARRAFDLAADPARIARALRSDPLLAPLVDRRPGLRIPGAWDPFECAVRAVLGQQVSVAAARTFGARLVARAGERIDGAAEGLTHLFPSPAALAQAELDGLGITRARAAALRALARAVCGGSIDFTRDANHAAARLAALPGFGGWTAQYVVLRGLGEPDAFPAGDLVLRRMAGGSGAAFSERQLASRAEAWRPWRGYAALHLWRAAVDAAASAR